MLSIRSPTKLSVPCHNLCCLSSYNTTWTTSFRKFRLSCTHHHRPSCRLNRHLNRRLSHRLNRRRHRRPSHRPLIPLMIPPLLLCLVLPNLCPLTQAPGPNPFSIALPGLSVSEETTAAPAPPPQHPSPPPSPHHAQARSPSSESLEDRPPSPSESWQTQWVASRSLPLRRPTRFAHLSARHPLRGDRGRLLWLRRRPTGSEI